MGYIEEHNDAITKVDCKLMNRCCNNPDMRNQFGSRHCVCMNCGTRCRECSKDYLKDKINLR